MNINIKLSISDAERNLLMRKMTGKDVKGLATRADINRLVEGFIEGIMTELSLEQKGHEVASEVADMPIPVRQFDQSRVPEHYRHKSIEWQIGWYRGRYIIKPTRI